MHDRTDHTKGNMAQAALTRLRATVRCPNCGAHATCDVDDDSTLNVHHECFVRTLGVTGVETRRGIAWWRVNPARPMAADDWEPLADDDPAAVEAQRRWDEGGGRIITTGGDA